MMFDPRKVVIFVLSMTAFSCGPATSRYPSYEWTIAQYVPPSEQRPVRMTTAGSYPEGRTCDCPRVWYHGTWVYYYRGRWIYWDRGYWYHDPGLYVYYSGGYPYVYGGPHRTITKGEPGGHHSRTRPHRRTSKGSSGRTVRKGRPTSD